MFTLTDALIVAADLFPDPSAADVAAVITDAIADGIIPNTDRHWARAAAAARLPRRSVVRMIKRLYPNG